MKRPVKPPVPAKDEDDLRGPGSVPYELTREQRPRVRLVLRRIRDERGNYAALVEDIGYPAHYMRAFSRGEAKGQRHFAAQVARVAGVDLDDLLSGKAK